MSINPLAVKFGKQIKKLRLAQELSQEDLANLCGLHRTYIGPVERGEKNITIETAKKLTDALGISLSEFFTQIEDS